MSSFKDLEELNDPAVALIALVMMLVSSGLACVYFYNPNLFLQADFLKLFLISVCVAFPGVLLLSTALSVNKFIKEKQHNRVMTLSFYLAALMYTVVTIGLMSVLLLLNVDPKVGFAIHLSMILALVIFFIVLSFHNDNAKPN